MSYDQRHFQDFFKTHDHFRIPSVAPPPGWNAASTWELLLEGKGVCNKLWKVGAIPSDYSKKCTHPFKVCVAILQQRHPSLQHVLHVWTCWGGHFAIETPSITKWFASLKRLGAAILQQRPPSLQHVLHVWTCWGRPFCNWDPSITKWFASLNVVGTAILQ